MSDKGWQPLYRAASRDEAETWVRKNRDRQLRAQGHYFGTHRVRRFGGFWYVDWKP